MMSEPVRIGEAELWLGGSAMKRGMRFSGGQFKVLDPVVRSVSVPMMNKFCGFEFSSQMALHHNAMLSPAISVESLRADDDISVIDSLAMLEKMMSWPGIADNITMEAPATFRHPFAERPFHDFPFCSAIADAYPVMRFSNSLDITDDDKSPESMSCQIGNLVLASILCNGGYHVGSI